MTRIRFLISITVFMTSNLVLAEDPATAHSPDLNLPTQSVSVIKKVLSSESTPSNLLKIRQVWGAENMMRMYDRYEQNFEEGHYISSFSSLLEDSFTIAGVAYDFAGISCPFCIGVSAIYWGFYLAPGWFYRAANLSYAALDAKKAYLPIEEFNFHNSTEFLRSAYLKCEFYASEDEIKSNHRTSMTNFVKRDDIPEQMRQLYYFEKGQFENTEYVVVPGRWLRLAAKNADLNHAAFGTLANAVVLENACALAGIKAGYPDLEKLKPVITVENNSWVGSYPVFFYVEGIDDHHHKVAAKLVPKLAESHHSDACNCKCPKQ